VLYCLSLTKNLTTRIQAHSVSHGRSISGCSLKNSISYKQAWLWTKFQMDGSSASLIVKIKQKAEEKFRTTAWLLLSVLQNFVSTEVACFFLCLLRLIIYRAFSKCLSVELASRIRATAWILFADFMGLKVTAFGSSWCSKAVILSFVIIVEMVKNRKLGDMRTQMV
jgi:hypothetical protein